MKGNWDLISVGLLGLFGLLVTLLTRRRSSVFLPSPKEDSFQKHIEQKASEATNNARQERDQGVQEATGARQSTLNEQISEMQSNTDTLLDNPDELNDHLLEVGKKVRNGAGS